MKKYFKTFEEFTFESDDKDRKVNDKEIKDALAELSKKKKEEEKIPKDKLNQ